MQDKAVFTKEDILDCLSKKGYYIDSFTLDTFLNKLNINSIYEQDGIEYYETDTVEVIIEKIFNKTEAIQGADMENDKVLTQTNSDDMMPSLDDDQNDVLNILKEVSLSDGSNLMDRVQNMSIVDVEENREEIEKEIKEKEEKETQKKFNEPKRPGILEGAMQSIESDTPDSQKQNKLSQDEFEDLTTLSNTFKELGVKDFEAQSIRDNNGQLTKQMNDIAKIMAKKIAKYVSTICMQEAKSAIRLGEAQEEILKLNHKIRTLEEQIKKVRLLLAESNRNLNSYKPSVFGLYKKEKTKKR